ncbi:MAG: hypothetical protein NXH91_03985 [Phyllobacteriaceae bacterium]|nr:hypothetical protein [Phyllobacteriaceae bacterium]
MRGNGAEGLIADHLPDWQTGWSMGAFGALAEFHQDDGEPALVDDTAALTRATARGAIRFDPAVVDRLQPIAYEALSPKPHRWSHAVALCLPAEEAACARRSVLTELGPDTDAIAPQNRTDILFDMGLSLANCDFCVRTADPDLLSVLRANEGRSLFEPDNPAMGAILKAHPHRVAITRAGRAEVFQKIGGPDTGGVSPQGPHTHVLPKLMASGRTHTANTPIPDAMVPVAFLHPGSPVIGPLGEDRAFDPDLHRRFQALLDAHGRPPLVAVKRRVNEALAKGRAPADFEPPNGRHERAALRIALRQNVRLAEHADDAGLSQLVAAWRTVFDMPRSSDEADDEAPGH